MTKRQQLYEGKAKVIFEGPEAGTLVQYFKDDATAFNAQKKDVIKGKGVLNNYISEHIMTAVGDLGIPNHFIARLNDCLLYTSPSPRDKRQSRMPSSA